MNSSRGVVMLYFAELRKDDAGKVIGADVIQQTTVYRDRQLMRVRSPISSHDTLGDALAEVRRLNAAKELT
jgi:hypothetical protein